MLTKASMSASSDTQPSQQGVSPQAAGQPPSAPGPAPAGAATAVASVPLVRLQQTATKVAKPAPAVAFSATSHSSAEGSAAATAVAGSPQPEAVSSRADAAQQRDAATARQPQADMVADAAHQQP